MLKCSLWWCVAFLYSLIMLEHSASLLLVMELSLVKGTNGAILGRLGSLGVDGAIEAWPVH